MSNRDEDRLNKKRQHLMDLDRDEGGIGGEKVAETEKLRELMERGDRLIEQLNNLYNQYVLGVLDLPPKEIRAQLDQIINTTSLMGKPTRALRFQFNSLQSKFVLYRERWEKKLKDLESGKIQRITGRDAGRKKPGGNLY